MFHEAERDSAFSSGLRECACTIEMRSKLYFSSIFLRRHEDDLILGFCSIFIFNIFLKSEVKESKRTNDDMLLLCKVF